MLERIDACQMPSTSRPAITRIETEVAIRAVLIVSRHVVTAFDAVDESSDRGIVGRRDDDFLLSRHPGRLSQSAHVARVQGADKGVDDWLVGFADVGFARKCNENGRRAGDRGKVTGVIIWNL